MGISKAQKLGVVVVCKCGCGEQFRAFPVYRSREEGGGLRTPDYIRGHHPNCRKTQTGNVPVWNKGLRKGDHPSIDRMGFQPGHKPHNDWSKVNNLLATNPEIKAKWIAAKKGQVAWNTGLTREQYANGIASGPSHGNWKGGFGGARDTAEWGRMRRSIMQRDNFTCVECGDRNRQGRGKRIRLEVHHIVAICQNPNLTFDPNNLVTLCSDCHRRTHNFGNKAKK